MADINSIEHKGIVENINGKKISVRISKTSACSSCHAKNACIMHQEATDIIEIGCDNPDEFSVGEEAMVVMERVQGFKALFLGYLLPFLVFLTTLIIASVITGNEKVSGLLAILILIPYYIGLFLFRNKLENSFGFKIKKI